VFLTAEGYTAMSADAQSDVPIIFRLVQHPQQESSMKYFRTIVALLALYLVTSSALYATPANLDLRVNAMAHKAKVVRFTLLNDSNSPMELKVGDDILRLEAGKSANVKLPVGARVLLNSDTQLHHQGDIVTEVSNSLDGAIVHLK
jgi:hypothetical protein